MASELTGVANLRSLFEKRAQVEENKSLPVPQAEDVSRRVSKTYC